MRKKLNFLVTVMQKKYNMGETLESIYNQVINAYGKVHGAPIFNEFCEKNKENEGFMKEFNKTVFI